MVVYQQPESLATRFLWGHIYPGVKRAGDIAWNLARTRLHRLLLMS